MDYNFSSIFYNKKGNINFIWMCAKLTTDKMANRSRLLWLSVIYRDVAKSGATDCWRQHCDGVQGCGARWKLLKIPVRLACDPRARRAHAGSFGKSGWTGRLGSSAGPYGNDHVGATFSPAEIKGKANLDKETTREPGESRLRQRAG